MGLEDSFRKRPSSAHPSNTKKLRAVTPTKFSITDDEKGTDKPKSVTESTFDVGDEGSTKDDRIFGPTNENIDMISERKINNTQQIFTRSNGRTIIKLPSYILSMQSKFTHHSDLFRAIEAYRSYINKKDIKVEPSCLETSNVSYEEDDGTVCNEAHPLSFVIDGDIHHHSLLKCNLFLPDHYMQSFSFSIKPS